VDFSQNTGLGIAGWKGRPGYGTELGELPQIKFCLTLAEYRKPCAVQLKRSFAAYRLADWVMLMVFSRRSQHDAAHEDKARESTRPSAQTRILGVVCKESAHRVR
jgi:hypothetical protein